MIENLFQETPEQALDRVQSDLDGCVSTAKSICEEGNGTFRKIGIENLALIAVNRKSVKATASQSYECNYPPPPSATPTPPREMPRPPIETATPPRPITTCEDPEQLDSDGDTIGDACDACPNDGSNDADGDGVCQDTDNCPDVSNSDQADSDADGIADACDICPNDASNDLDADGICQNTDNCLDVSNPEQTDSDGDTIGDACDACPNDGSNDLDADGVCQDTDNCLIASNPEQTDSDGDTMGDACDACPNDGSNDADGDGICRDIDNCPSISNSDQGDGDTDGIGDACDVCPNNGSIDPDADGVCSVDSCTDDPDKTEPGECGCGVPDTDTDNDGTPDCSDNCPSNPEENAGSEGVACGDAPATLQDITLELFTNPPVCATCQRLENQLPAITAGALARGYRLLVTNIEPGMPGWGPYTAGDSSIPVARITGGFQSSGAELSYGADNIAYWLRVRSRQLPPLPSPGGDNCSDVSNPDQSDSDGDAIGDACDTCPNDVSNDSDADGVCQDSDNCPDASNSGQEDEDGDGVGNACDSKQPPIFDLIEELGSESYT